MSIKIRPVETNHVSQVWPLVEKYLVDSLVKGGEKEGVDICYNIHHVQSFLTSGSWLLLVAVDEQNKIHGAATVSFINYPIHRIAFITLAGGQFIVNGSVLKQLWVILRQRGATKVQAYGRDSMVRLLRRNGFKPQTTLLEANL
jgi:hypothetical protein